MPTASLPSRTSVKRGKRGQKRKENAKKTKTRLYLFSSLTILVMLWIGMAAMIWLFFTPSGNSVRFLMADTLITTQHRHWAKYIIGQAELDKRVAAYQAQFEQMGEEKDTHTIAAPQQEETKEEKPLVEIEEVSGSGYHGYVLTVNDPTKIRLGVRPTRQRREGVQHGAADRSRRRRQWRGICRPELERQRL
ncbi:hypothetical protein HMSSN036_48560 [Paenibacillus macerans]|nr:hypothetical protein HMSSN036_48560 [Paenibacillus macerans]